MTPEIPYGYLYPEYPEWFIASLVTLCLWVIFGFVGFLGYVAFTELSRTGLLILGAIVVAFPLNVWGLCWIARRFP